MSQYVHYSPNSDPDKCNVIITKRASSPCKRKVNRNAFFQLGLIVLSFAIGYLPISAYYMWSTDVYVYHYKKIVDVDCGDATIRVELYQDLTYLDYLFSVISYICMRFSECMNPFLYSVGSKKLRVEIKSVLSSLGEKCSCL